MLREILEELLNKYRVVKTDEDLEWNRAVDMCRNIIEKHINDGKGTNVPTKDGWISVVHGCTRPQHKCGRDPGPRHSKRQKVRR